MAQVEKAAAPHHRLGLTDDQLLEMHRHMVTARLLDERMWALNRQGKAPFVVSAAGHEACQVAAAFCLERGADYWVPYYRDLCMVLVAGLTPKDVLLGVFAKAEDPCSGGRQMPAHWGSRRLGIITGSSPIATQIPHAVGAAYALKLRREPAVVMSCFGEGATSEGDWHEAMNFAGIHHLPIVFVCENNRYAISVPQTKQMGIENVADRAAAYGFEGHVVDGNDVLACYEPMRAAVEKARAGGGPTLIEAKTYRFAPHTSDDDDRTYRTREEVEAWRQRDPVPRFEAYLKQHGLIGDERIDAIREEVRSEITEAIRGAEEAPFAPPEHALRHVYGKVAERRPPAESDGRAGSPATRKTLIKTIHDTMWDLMEADDRVLVMGEDVGARGGVFRATDGFLEQFGEERVIDTPLAESSIVGHAIGMAVAGLLPIAEIQFADFIHPAFDQLVSEAARIRYRSNGDFDCPIVVRAPYGGGVHGALYHSQSVEAFYAHVPGLKVVVPSTPYDAKGMLRAAVYDPDPVLFFEHKKCYRLIQGDVPDGDYEVEIGKADVKREGERLTVIAYGLMMHLSLEAARRLAAEEGVEAEVVDLRTISPLDWETIAASVRKTSKALVVSEDNRTFGVGAEISARIGEELMYDLDAPVVRMGALDVPAMPFAKPMEEFYMPSADKIYATMRDLARA